MTRVSKMLRAALAATVLIPIAGQAATAPVGKKPAAAAGRQDSNPQPSYSPVPEWVTSFEIPAANASRKDDPFQFLMINSQEYLTKDGARQYGEYVVQPQNQVGVQAFGTVVLPWNVHQTSLTLHEVKVLRGSETIDALRKEDVSVIQRETKLEEATLNGVRTVVLPVRDLRPGDKLKVAFTTETKPRSFGKTEDIQDMHVDAPVQRLIRRFVVEDGVDARWAVDPSLKAAKEQKLSGATERTFELTDWQPPKKVEFQPDRFSRKLVQVSTFRSWSEVAEPMIAYYDAASEVADGSPVAELADKIATEHQDQGQRLLAALRLAQDDVRYAALLLGEGNYKPMSAAEVWEKRFGDCKGKTALLMAILDRLQINAEPVLASVTLDASLAGKLPTLAMFDHIFVRARVAGQTYYLDGTGFGQRTLEELKQSPTKHILPVVAGAELATTPDVMPSAPLYDTHLVWNASKGVTADVPFTAKLTMRGPAAAQMRLKALGSTDKDKLLESIKNHVVGVPNDLLELVSSHPEMADGTYVVHFNGEAQLDWSPVEGLKGNRLQLNQSTITWDTDFGRDKEAAKDIPVALAFPYWLRSTEQVVLPDDGRAFDLDAEQVDKIVAATRIKRAISKAGPLVTVINDFQRLATELPAHDARAAAEPLEVIGSQFAYVVSRKKLKTAD